MRLVRRLWSEEHVTHDGEHFHVTGSTVLPRIEIRQGRPHPPLYFEAPRPPPSGSPRPRPMSNSSGASRWRTLRNASTASKP
jgi:hypothetical protein